LWLLLCFHTALPARRRVDVALPLFLLLFALGKIEEIILYSLIFCSLVQGTMLSRGLLLQQLECGKPPVGQQARPFPVSSD